MSPDGQRMVEEDKSSPWTSLVSGWKYKGLIPVALGTVLRYYTTGPPLETWTLQVNLLSNMVRKLNSIQGQDSDVSDAEARQMAISRRKSITKLIEKDFVDGVGFEVRIPIKQLGLGGLLERADSAEDGSRHVAAEWQIHESIQSCPSERIVLFLHGGAYMAMNPATHRGIILTLSRILKARVLSVDYRLAPEYVFPAGLHDSVAVYLHLINTVGVNPASITVAGDSAGGGMTMALLLYLRDSNLPLPGAAVLLSPWCDLTMSLRSWEENAASSQPRLYVGSDNLEHLTHPYASSCFADLGGITTKMLIQAGGVETLRDEATLLAHRAHAAGVDVTYQIFAHGVHVFQGQPSDATTAAFEALDEWHKRLSSAQAGSKASAFAEVDRRLQEEYAARTKKQGLASSTKATVKRKFIFEPVQRDAPAIELRSHAHVVAKKAVEEDQARGTPKGLTTMFVHQRNKA